MSTKNELEQQFKAALCDAVKKAGEQYGIREATALLPTLLKTDGAAYAHETLRRGAESRLFSELCRIGHPELTLEALVIQSRFAALFSDTEVNASLDRLCEIGYFG